MKKTSLLKRAIPLTIPFVLSGCINSSDPDRVYLTDPTKEFSSSEVNKLTPGDIFQSAVTGIKINGDLVSVSGDIQISNQAQESRDGLLGTPRLIETRYTEEGSSTEESLSLEHFLDEDANLISVTFGEDRCHIMGPQKLPDSLYVEDNGTFYASCKNTADDSDSGRLQLDWKVNEYDADTILLSSNITKTNLSAEQEYKLETIYAINEDSSIEFVRFIQRNELPANSTLSVTSE